ncbi:MAG: hypothetical protein IJV00_01670 [Clostridia bacterium]|nr:hypothetical protein [Clostridia bacterium]
MTQRLKNKLKSRSGMSRLVAILLVAVAVIAVIVIGIPVVRYYNEESQKIGCNTALDTAYRQYVDHYLANGNKLDRDETKEVITFVMNGWDDLCPGGGNVYIVADDEKEEGMFRLVCGLHGKDEKERTRLNAGYVLDTLRELLAEKQKNGEKYPESITMTLNGKKLECLLTDEPTGIRRGTSTTGGLEGTVAYYSIVGHSDFGKDSGMEEGGIWYLSFADENYCAEWKFAQSWSGDSWK